MGWDNYSSYFNIRTNLFRTLFAAWREYRGLGVPSDSEVTDIFRQVFFFVLGLVFSQSLLDQLYYVFAVAFGTLSMYMLCIVSYRLYFMHHEKKWEDLVGFVGAFFYLFNLNTLATFYFPMVMFVTRYFAIPYLLLMFLLLIHDKLPLTRRNLLLMLPGLGFSMGAFMVPTVFVTFLMALAIFLPFQPKLKRLSLIVIMFLGLNAFWLLPFANYTIQKTGIMRYAPNFVDANEVLLNKSPSYFDIRKQSILFSNFFEMTFTAVGRQQYFHPLSPSLLQGSIAIYSLYLLPFLIAAGGLVILVPGVRKRALWIPATAVVFLMLSQKEYSALGFLYSFLTKQFPLVGVVFRFGDTKFHVFVAVVGSICAAFAVMGAVHAAAKRQWALRMTLGLLGILLVAYLFPFRTYFDGNFIGFFMYNRIPAAYFDIARKINADPEPARVLHLPMDRYGYWKSYSWGYFGSSFLNFMLDKPILDKTFEPASMENAYIDAFLNDVQANTQGIENGKDVEARAGLFLKAARAVGAKYLIFDPSVSIQVPSRGITYWGTQSSESLKKIIAVLEADKEVVRVGEYPVDPGTIRYDLYPHTKQLPSAATKLVLYRFASFAPRFSFRPAARVIDPEIKNAVAKGMTGAETLMQLPEANRGFEYLPFLRKDMVTTVDHVGKTLTLTYPRTSLPVGEYTVQAASRDQPSQSHLLDVYATVADGSLTVDLVEHPFPDIGSITFVAPVGSAAFKDVFKTKDVLPPSSYKIRIDGVILPLLGDAGRRTLLGSLIAHGPGQSVELLRLQSSTSLDDSAFFLQDNPNCYADKLTGYASSLDVSVQGTTHISARNGSVCFVAKTALDAKTNASLIELSLKAIGTQADLDRRYMKSPNLTTKPRLDAAITSLPKPNDLHVCMRAQDYPACLNSRTIWNVGGVTELSVYADKGLGVFEGFWIDFVLPTIVYQQKDLALSEARINAYSTIGTKTATLAAVMSSQSFSIEEPVPLSLGMPLAYSTHSGSSREQGMGFHYSNGACAEGSSRTFRTTETGLVSLINNCSNELFMQLPFSSTHMYIWNTEYNLGAGQYPLLILEDGLHKYVRERMSLYQGYPDIPGFKSFQDPETWGAGGMTQSVQKPAYANATFVIAPQPEIGDEKDKQYLIHQDGENEGMFSVASMDIREIPDAWDSLRIIPAYDTFRAYAVPSKTSFHQIIPSVWKVDYESRKGSPNLLVFNEAYDKQWMVVDGTVGGLVFGSRLETEHGRCDGFANCFVLDSKIDGVKSVYVVYWPEKLAIAGWVITLTCLIGCARLFHRKKGLVSSSGGKASSHGHASV